ncbi:hypothetical protein BGZ83_004393 [Gryganskiella cystojenkinii]|nr:hypothetical protein BGZ83_004393 [Gryganskiella cystojenkinii]
MLITAPVHALMHRQSCSMSGQQRLQSLDLLRGISIVLMILVNTQGADPFEQLAHSTWFGYTLADWVFPNFIFMVGVAVALVFNPKRLSVLSSVNNSTGPWHQRHRKRLLASALLELIGLPRNGLWLRVPGVLQRIALCYLVLALSVLWTDSNRRPPSTLKESAFRSWKLPLICTGLWFLIMFAVKSTATEPIEECRYPASAYSSSGLVQSGNAPSRGQLSPPLCTAQAFLDTVLFTLDRDTNHPIVDAEGTVGSLMAIVSGWFGWMLGRMLLVQQQSSAAMVKNTTRLRDFEQRQLEDSVDNAAPNCPSNQSRLWSGCSMTANSETTRTDVIQVWSDHHTKTDPTIPCASEQQQQQAIDETRGGSTSSTQTVESTTMGEAMNKIDHSQRQFMLAHMTEWLMAGVSLTLAGTVLDWGRHLPDARHWQRQEHSTFVRDVASFGTLWPRHSEF